MPGVLARYENQLARQGPSQHPRECEKRGLGSPTPVTATASVATAKATVAAAKATMATAKSAMGKPGATANSVDMRNAMATTMERFAASVMPMAPMIAPGAAADIETRVTIEAVVGRVWPVVTISTVRSRVIGAVAGTP